MYELTNVTKTYDAKRGRITALSDVTLTIPDGQMVAIQGPTGGGKSTLLQMLGALERPTSGTVALGTDVLSKMPDSKLAGIRAERGVYRLPGGKLQVEVVPTQLRDGRGNVIGEIG